MSTYGHKPTEQRVWDFFLAALSSVFFLPFSNQLMLAEKTSRLIQLQDPLSFHSFTTWIKPVNSLKDTLSFLEHARIFSRNSREHRSWVFFLGIELLLEGKVEKSSDFHLKWAIPKLPVIKKALGY